MKNSEKIFKFIDLNDAAEELELSVFLLAKGLKKRGCRLYLRFDSESTRMGELVFEQHPSHNWDYRIEPRKIYELTSESFSRTIRMLEKNKLSYEGLRIKIEAGDLLLNVKIKKEDEGMHLVLLKEDFERHSDSLKHLGRIQTKQKGGISKVSRNSHPLVAKLFWRTRNTLITEERDHTYKDIWDAIYEEWNETEQKGIIRKELDIDEIVVLIDPSNLGKDARMQWYYMTGNCEGSFKLNSLSALISKTKNNPPEY
jgi:hypothetical protein